MARRWYWAANGVALLHLTYFAAVIISPWLPWWVQSCLIAAPVWGLIANRGACRITQWEFALRRRGGAFVRGQGLIRRLLNAPGLLLPARYRWDVEEKTASAVNVVVLAATLLARYWVQGAAYFR